MIFIIYLIYTSHQVYTNLNKKKYLQIPVIKPLTLIYNGMLWNSIPTCKTLHAHCTIAKKYTGNY